MQCGYRDVGCRDVAVMFGPADIGGRALAHDGRAGIQAFVIVGQFEIISISSSGVIPSDGGLRLAVGVEGSL